MLCRYRVSNTTFPIINYYFKILLQNQHIAFLFQDRFEQQRQSHKDNHTNRIFKIVPTKISTFILISF